MGILPLMQKKRVPSWKKLFSDSVLLDIQWCLIEFARLIPKSILACAFFYILAIFALLFFAKWGSHGRKSITSICFMQHLSTSRDCDLHINVWTALFAFGPSAWLSAAFDYYSYSALRFLNISTANSNIQICYTFS